MIRIFLVRKDDPQFSAEGMSELDKENQWRYYIASYTTIGDTDGVNQETLTPVLLYKNMHAVGADPRSNRFPPLPLPLPEPAVEGQEAPRTTTEVDIEGSAVGDRLLARFLAAKNDEGLVIRIAVNNYHPLFQPGTAEGFFEDMGQREGGEEGVREAEGARSVREEGMKDGFVLNNEGMEGLSKDQVEERNANFVQLSGGDSGARAEVEKREADGGVEDEKMEVD